MRRNTKKYEMCGQEFDTLLNVVDLYAVSSVTFGATDSLFDCRS